MEPLFREYFWILKALGIGTCAALTASVLVTYTGTLYLNGEAQVAEQGTATISEPATDEPDEPEDTPTTALSGRSSDTGRKRTVEQIVAQNPFCPSCSRLPPGPGPHPPGGSAPGEQPPGIQPGERPCTLPLYLIATMESTLPLASQATIHDIENGITGPFWPTDALRPGVTLVSVERGRVHVKNGDALEYIELGIVPPKRPMPPVKPPPGKEDAPRSSRGIPGMEDAIKCDSANSCTVARDFIDQLFANPGMLAKQARVSPSSRDGTQGFKFNGVLPGSLPEALGLRNGDLVTSVNGSQLGSIDQVLGLMTKLRRANNLSVTIDRKGASITKDITIQ
jgi:general secretion pathway protein C